MASAVLPSRNEHYWSELDGNSRQFTSNPHFHGRLNSSPNPPGLRNPINNPNFSMTRQFSDHTANTDPLPGNASSQMLPPLPPPKVKVKDDAPSARRIEGPFLLKDSFRREHVTFHLSSYSKSELKELKVRLVSELRQVRALLNQIETRNLEVGHGFRCPQFSLRAVETSLKESDPPADERAPKCRPTGFVTGNGNDNHKFGGHKRALASAGARETKRPMAATTEAKALRFMMNKCKHILTNLMTQRYGYVFNKPVDVEGLKLYDYYEIIKHPMDLGTIKTKLNKGEYKSPLDFAADVRLTFGNAMTYNPKGSHVHNIAETMLLGFEKNFRKKFQQFEGQEQKPLAAKKNQNVSRVWRGSPVMISKKVEGKLIGSKAIEPVVVSSPSSQKEQAKWPRTLQSSKGKLPKPKAKDPNKREMTDEEKAELSLNMQKMPLEKMEQMVHIVGKRNPKLTQEGGEVEIDIEALDNETLWDLDRFVSNHHKKTVIKMKRPEFRYDAITLLQEDPKLKSSDTEPHQELAMEIDKKGDAGEEDVDIGEDTPPIEFSPVKIEKDPISANSGTSSSGSSSSSSDGSSSSDSDSGSTSESDSDEDNVQSSVVKNY